MPPSSYQMNLYYPILVVTAFTDKSRRANTYCSLKTRLYNWPKHKQAVLSRTTNDRACPRKSGKVLFCDAVSVTRCDTLELSARLGFVLVLNRWCSAFELCLLPTTLICRPRARGGRAIDCTFWGAQTQSFNPFSLLFCALFSVR